MNPLVWGRHLLQPAVAVDTECGSVLRHLCQGQPEGAGIEHTVRLVSAGEGRSLGEHVAADGNGKVYRLLGLVAGRVHGVEAD